MSSPARPVKDADDGDRPLIHTVEDHKLLCRVPMKARGEIVAGLASWEGKELLHSRHEAVP